MGDSQPQSVIPLESLLYVLNRPNQEITEKTALMLRVEVCRLAGIRISEADAIAWDELAMAAAEEALVLRAAAKGVASAESSPADGKRRHQRGKGVDLWIAALSNHHQYQDGEVRHLAPMATNVEFARTAGISPTMSSRHFAKYFDSWDGYKDICTQYHLLRAKLQILNRDFTAHVNPPPK
ncbi:MAG: hypothetical protein ACYC3X_06125 [Pirellulaceae bacterium]